MTHLRRHAIAALLLALVTAGCGDDSSSSVTLPPLTSTVATASSSTTTAATATTAALTPTTTAAVTAGSGTSCSAPASHVLSGGGVVTPPARSTLKCEAGWRLFGWIGESGDGILLLQRTNASSWTVVYYGPGCGGVASAPVNDLVSYGLPRALAEKWGGGCG